MLEGRVLVAALARQPESTVEGFLEVLGQHGHRTTSTGRTNKLRTLLFLQGALEWVLVLTSVIHRLGHLGLGDLIGVNAAYPDTLLMDMEHDPGRFFAVLLKDVLQNVD